MTTLTDLSHNCGYILAAIVLAIWLLYGLVALIDKGWNGFVDEYLLGVKTIVPAIFIVFLLVFFVIVIPNLDFTIK